MVTVARILVALDLSPGSDAIVEYACAVARGAGAQLALLHVYDPPNAMVGVVPGASIGGDVAAGLARGQTLLDHAAELVVANGLARPERVIERAGPTWATIANHARIGRFDLIVMGTHARSGIARLVLGSVAEHVLRSATCAVLVVHLPHE